MTWHLRTTLLFLVACLAPGAAASAAEFNRTVPVSQGTRLDVRLYGGEIIVRAWDHNDVRVRATHFTTDQIDLRPLGLVLQLRARARVGTPHAIDVEIDVPAWMELAIAGTYLDISIAGMRGGIKAETVRGDISVKGGAGSLTLKSIEGDVTLDGGEGRADLTAVNNGVRVTGWTGDLVANTVNGSVTLERLRSTSIEVGTVGGDIRWDGPLVDQGHYQFATHDGDIDVTVGDREGAAVSVRAFEGHFRATFPVKLPDEAARRRFGFVLGSGAAQLSLETFRGTISLRRPAGSS